MLGRSRLSGWSCPGEAPSKSRNKGWAAIFSLPFHNFRQSRTPKLHPLAAIGNVGARGKLLCPRPSLPREKATAPSSPKPGKAREPRQASWGSKAFFCLLPPYCKITPACRVRHAGRDFGRHLQFLPPSAARLFLMSCFTGCVTDEHVACESVSMTPRVRHRISLSSLQCLGACGEHASLALLRVN